jgi:A/G-specific adenine glycosylase
MDFYRKAGRENLPWRGEDITAYEVWVSEIMLQQTQVSRVLDYYVKFLRRFPTVALLAQASWEEFLPYYAGLGYYRRGRNMLLTALKVMDEFGGEFPRDKKLLMTLPGVGDYTASAILSFAYGDNHLAWDTNLKRVIGRFFYGSKDGSEISQQDAGREFVTPSLGLKSKQKVQVANLNPQDNSVMGDVFKTHAKELNAALMDFGAAICVGRPKCKTCPLSSRCLYFSEEGAREIKVKEEKSITQGFIQNSGFLDPRVKPEDDNAKDQDNKGKKQEKEKIDWRDAQVFLWLHKEHKLYYSSNPKQFKVFVLLSPYTSRAGIKAYFRDNHNLDLAVRPPHTKTIVAGKPTLFVNAQILLGEPGFTTFSKDDVKRYNESMS